MKPPPAGRLRRATNPSSSTQHRNWKLSYYQLLYALRTQHLGKRGIKATISQPDDQRANRRRLGRAGGRPPAFDRDQYRRRNTVERTIGKLKQHRAVATRYDKRDYIFNGTLATAAIIIWLRDLTKEPSDTA